MVYTSIAYIHVITSFIISIYFVYRNPKYDIYYLLYFCLLNISWTVFHNECLISYIFKKYNDTAYVLGENTDIIDYEIVLGKEYSTVFLKYILIMYAFNLLFILYSLKSLSLPIITVFLSFMIYILSLRENVSSDTKKIFQQINLISNILLLICIVNFKNMQA